MKIILLLVALTAFTCQNIGSKGGTIDSHTIYLVRHAEKADDGTKDPPLTEAGEKRASYLAEMLKEKGIKKIYSTDYKRTKNTAAPLSEMLGIQTTIYDPRDTSFYNTLRLESNTMNIFIVGHSNSTPALTNAIIGEEKFAKLDESVYDQMFQVESKDGRLTGKVKAMGEVK